MFFKRYRKEIVDLLMLCPHRSADQLFGNITHDRRVRFMEGKPQTRLLEFVWFWRKPRRLLFSIALWGLERNSRSKVRIERVLRINYSRNRGWLQREQEMRRLYYLEQA